MPKPRFKIEPRDIGTWMCSSETEAGAAYVVDVIELTCSCPAHHEGGLPCKHIEAVLAFVLSAGKHN